jgi:catechol 2,3-dioxygenase-like lactoylglutathione lyase family enzyme
MGIQRIESVTYGIDDLDECVRFFDDFGLFLVERTEEHAVFETLTGQTLHLDALTGPQLPPPVETGPTLREVVWGVDTPEELERLVTAVPKTARSARARTASTTPSTRPASASP